MQASDVAALMYESCSEVLETMFFTSVLGVAQAPAPDRAEEYAASLTFAGDISGRFGVELSNASARTLAANFLGEDETSLSAEEVGEVVGELANILCGSVVSHLKGEQKFVLSHPQLALSQADPMYPEEVQFERLDTDSGVVTTWVALDGSLPSHE